MYLLRVTCAWSCSKATAWLSLSVFISWTGFRKAEKQVPELCVRYWVIYLINRMYISTWILHKFNTITINFTTCFDKKLQFSPPCNIIHFVLAIFVPVLKITIALRQVYSVGSTFINLNLSMTSWSARISSMQADILSDVILLSDVTPKMIRFSYNLIYSQYDVDSMIYIRNARSGFLLDIST